MIIPIKCFSCGKLIAHKWEKYQKLLERNIKEADALDQLEITRYCCRRMMLTHVDIKPV